MRMTVRRGKANPEIYHPIAGQTILKALADAGITFYAPCGGKGTCGGCSVLVKDSQGIRHVLACQTTITEDIEIILEDVRHITVEGKDTPPENNRPASTSHSYGIAIDIGTTTMVFFLVDQEDGTVVATEGHINPQVVFGGDVIARIEASADPKRFKALCTLLRNTIDQSCQILCESVTIAPADLTLIYLAGNTVMEHFAAGLNPDTIGVAPFTPRSYFGATLPLYTDSGQVPREAFFAPAIASYVGGDITAGLSITDIPTSSELCLFVDIGTNGEMALGNKERIVSCATAAGPAFEGALITFGMPALPGAISVVSPTDEGFALQTIDNLPACGICGSGILDAVASLVTLGIADETGRILDADEAPSSHASFIDSVKGETVCYLDPEKQIYVSQKDVRNVQLAKAALRAGIETLIATFETDYDSIATVFLAGGFGMHLDPHSAATIGLLPPRLEEKVRPIGNAAGKGSVAAVASEKHRELIQTIGDSCEYLELSVSSIFNTYFVQAIGFDEEN